MLKSQDCNEKMKCKKICDDSDFRLYDNDKAAYDVSQGINDDYDLHVCDN